MAPGPRAHVAHVEQAAGRAAGLVLRDDARVLDRQLPAAEVDEPGARLLMEVEEWGSTEGHARLQSVVDWRPTLTLAEPGCRAGQGADLRVG